MLSLRPPDQPKTCELPTQLHTCPAVRSLLPQLVKVYKPLRKAQKGFRDVIHLILKRQEVQLLHNKLRALIGCTPSYEPTVPDSISVTFSSLTNAVTTRSLGQPSSPNTPQSGVCLCVCVSASGLTTSAAE